jgi:hypothetical protein
VEVSSVLECRSTCGFAARETAGNDTKDAMNKEIGDLTQRTEAGRS